MMCSKEVSRFSRAKQPQRNVQKSVLHVQVCTFLLIRSVDFDAVLIAVALKGNVTRDNSQRRFLAQHSVVTGWNNVVTIRNNIATMLQRCDALKIVVANRLV